MKVLLITSMPRATEVMRIQEEFVALGHDLRIIDTSDLRFTIVNTKLNVPDVTDQKYDLVILRGLLVHLKPFATLAQKLRESGTKVFDNNFLEHKYSISKVADFIRLSQASIPLPDTFFVSSWDEYKVAGEKLGYPFVIKSVRTGKGSGVYKMESMEEFESFINQMLKEDKKAKNFIAQKFIDYAFDLRVLVIGEQIFTMRRIPREGDFRANFSLGGSVELYDLEEKDRKLAISAMDAMKMSIGGVDILIDKSGGRYILEVNHTAGMMGMESATGKNIVKVYVEHILSEAK